MWWTKNRLRWVAGVVKLYCFLESTTIRFVCESATILYRIVFFFFFIIFACDLHARIIILICDYIFLLLFCAASERCDVIFIGVGKMVIKELEEFIDDLNCFSVLMELYYFPFECGLTWDGIAVEVENIVIDFIIYSIYFLLYKSTSPP